MNPQDKAPMNPSLETMKGKDLNEAWIEYWNYNVSMDSTERISKTVFFDAFRYGKAFSDAQIQALISALEHYECSHYDSNGMPCHTDETASEALSAYRAGKL